MDSCTLWNFHVIPVSVGSLWTCVIMIYGTLNTWVIMVCHHFVRIIFLLSLPVCVLPNFRHAHYVGYLLPTHHAFSISCLYYVLCAQNSPSLFSSLFALEIVSWQIQSLSDLLVCIFLKTLSHAYDILI